MTFETLGLSQPVLQALVLKEYTTPTPIQEQSIPLILSGRDLLGIAQTGTGKTAAFVLPSIDRLNASGKRARPRCCRMLVLAPTRELAGQIAQSARDYSRFAKMRIATVFGGTSINRNRQELAGGVDILIATPGRLVDLIERKALDIGSTEILVLDEADQMLDLGFIHALRQIVRLIPAERQTLLFSATMPKTIQKLASEYLKDPLQVAVNPAAATVDRVEQFVCHVAQSDKQALLTETLRQGFAAKDMNRVLVFTRTKHGADRVVRKLAQSNIRASAIHGNKSQPQRERALDEFKRGKVNVLVATDIAARGIDIGGVSHVINFELPNVAEQYVHRIGRTARAGAEGVAIAYCAADERDYLRDIQKLTKVTLTPIALPDSFSPEVVPLGGIKTKPHQNQKRGGSGRARVRDESSPRRSRSRSRSGRPGGGAKRAAT